MSREGRVKVAGSQAHVYGVFEEIIAEQQGIVHSDAQAKNVPDMSQPSSHVQIGLGMSHPGPDHISPPMFMKKPESTDTETDTHIRQARVGSALLLNAVQIVYQKAKGALRRG